MYGDILVHITLYNHQIGFFYYDLYKFVTHSMSRTSVAGNNKKKKSGTKFPGYTLLLFAQVVSTPLPLG